MFWIILIYATAILSYFRSYEEMENEVSQILGFRWYALNDKQYKLTPVNLNVPYYYEGFEEAE